MSLSNYSIYGLIFAICCFHSLALVKYQCQSKYFDCTSGISAADAEGYCKIVNGQFFPSFAGKCNTMCPTASDPYFGACCFDDLGDSIVECNARS